MKQERIIISEKLRKGVIFLLAPLMLLAACELGGDASSDFSSGEGSGGSMARFTIAGNHLYTVDHHTLNVLSLADPKNPVFKGKEVVGPDVETIFPFSDHLYLGTSTGMYIYDITSAADPKRVTFFEHIYACDPVVTDGKYAYVTLSSSNMRCWNNTNELQIIDIQDKSKPRLIATLPLASPRGLAIRNDTLWVCDDGIKLINVTHKEQPGVLTHFRGFPAYDIILNGSLALVTGEKGLVQFRLENDTIRKLSEIKVTY